MSARARVALVLLVAAGSLAAWWIARESRGSGPEVGGMPALGPQPATEAASESRPASAPVASPIRPRRLETTDAAVAPEPALDPTHLYVAGKVIDDRRRAVLGASIELVTEGREPLRSKTGPDGRFRIDWGPKPAAPPRGAVGAADASGRAAMVSLPEEALAGNVIDVGVLPLTELGVLAVRVVKDGAGVAGARVWAGPTHKLGFGPFVTDGEGSLGPKRFPEGAYIVTAFSQDLSARGEARVDVTRRAPASLDVNLAAAWRLGVTVKDASTGKGVADQVIVLTSAVRSSERGMSVFGTPLPKPIAPTNAEGRTVVEGLAPDQPIEVEVRPAVEIASPYPRMNTTRTKVAAGAEEVVITLNEGGQTFRFSIVADETDGPPDGAEVRLSALPGTSSAPPPPRGKVVGRDLVVEHLTERTRSLLATAPDGSQASLRISNEQMEAEAKIGSDAKFKKPRALVVTAHDSSGAALGGYLVQCRLPGNTALGPSVPTSADGTARIDGLYPWPVPVTVHLRRAGERERGEKAAGSADLMPPGEGRLDVILDPERACVLHVTVDGEKRLPPTFWVGIVGSQGMARGDVGPIDEDPDQATLRFSLRPERDAASITLGFSAQGFPYTTVSLPISKGGAPVEGRVALTSGATIRVQVLPPADGLHEVGLQVRDGDSWTDRGIPGQLEEMAKKATNKEASGLAAGRYRARDRLTGVVSETVDVAAGATADLTLDLSRAGVITGRVEGPAEPPPEGPPSGPKAAVARAMVSLEGNGLVRPGGMTGGISVAINSEFKARVPGDRPVTLRVTHAILSPDPEAGTATATVPGSSVVLRLVNGPEASFTTSGKNVSARELITDFHGSRPRVLLFRGPPEGEPVKTCAIVWEGKAWRFGGYAPGKYTLWCDPCMAVPFVLEDVRLGEGRTDLGEVTLVEGATLRLKVVAGDGKEPPYVSVSASPTSGPAYTRSNFARRGEALVRGLGPGRFKVEVGSDDARRVAATYEIVSTGSGEISLTHEVK